MVIKLYRAHLFYNAKANRQIWYFARTCCAKYKTVQGLFVCMCGTSTGYIFLVLSQKIPELCWFPWQPRTVCVRPKRISWRGQTIRNYGSEQRNHILKNLLSAQKKGQDNSCSTLSFAGNWFEKKKGWEKDFSVWWSQETKEYDSRQGQKSWTCTCLLKRYM